MSNTSVKAKRGRQSKKNALQRKLFAAKLQVKDLSVNPDDLFKYFDALGISLTNIEVVHFLQLQFAALRKSRKVEEPQYLLPATTADTLYLHYKDGTVITLYLNLKRVKYETNSITVWNDLDDSGLLPRILKDMPI